MVDEELIQRVRDLRTKGCSPKETARALGVPPARVAPLVRLIAEQAEASAPVPAIVGCWVSAGWSVGLTVDEGRGWTDSPEHGTNVTGLVGVLVAREAARKRDISVCGYLVDPYCLGVKDALGPRLMKPHELSRFVGMFFAAFDGEPLDAPIELARELVSGAVDYANRLGFEPARDFGAAQGALGAFDGQRTIGFGRDGMPCYVQGPYDDAEAIMMRLDESVGVDNFHFLVECPVDATSLVSSTG